MQKYHVQNYAIICLYYYPQKVCNFSNVGFFQIKLKNYPLLWANQIAEISHVVV